MLGALLSENWYAINTASTLLRAICVVGPAAVQLVNQKIPFSAVRNLPTMIQNPKTRYRVSRWVLSMIRNDPQTIGKQILLRQDIIVALAEGIYRDSEVLLNDVRFGILDDA